MQSQSNSFLAIAVAIACAVVAPSRVLAECDSGNCDAANSAQVRPAGWRGQWYVLETENFQICCERSETPAKDLAERAESLRSDLVAKWLGSSATSDVWQP